MDWSTLSLEEAGVLSGCEWLEWEAFTLDFLAGEPSTSSNSTCFLWAILYLIYQVSFIPSPIFLRHDLIYLVVTGHMVNF